MNAFKKYILATYEKSELKDIAEHGCASYAPAGMIYYTETTELYNTYKDDLHEMLGDYMDMVGDTPKVITDSLDNAATFANAMVWLCTELIAYEVTENEDN
jgi:hypothetical protein